MSPPRVLVTALLLAGLGAATIRICADGGAMASAYRSCDCVGFEYLIYDRTAADGPRRTFCVGWIRSRTCYRNMSGPVVPCPGWWD